MYFEHFLPFPLSRKKKVDSYFHRYFGHFLVISVFRIGSWPLLGSASMHAKLFLICSFWCHSYSQPYVCMLFFASMRTEGIYVLLMQAKVGSFVRFNVSAIPSLILSVYSVPEIQVKVLKMTQQLP
nr:unnamed protein product [Callosobruchus analis]